MHGGGDFRHCRKYNRSPLDGRKRGIIIQCRGQPHSGAGPCNYYNNLRQMAGKWPANGRQMAGKCYQMLANATKCWQMLAAFDIIITINSTISPPANLPRPASAPAPCAAARLALRLPSLRALRLWPPFALRLTGGPAGAVKMTASGIRFRR